MNIEKYNYDEKKNRHVEMKKDQEARVGPGAYINPKMHSEFRPEARAEYLQFFGSTEERFKSFMGGAVASTGAIMLPATGSLGEQLAYKGDAATLPGPGTYDPNTEGHSAAMRKVATAAF